MKFKMTSNIKVLMYHRVLPNEPDETTGWHYVTENQFRWQIHKIDMLGYTPITFRDYKLGLEGELSLPRKPIILTFDDGYLDTSRYAVPILEEKNMRAVIYVMGHKAGQVSLWDEGGRHSACPLMSDEQIRSLDAAGHEIGSHCIQHRPLPELSDEEIRHELQESKQTLEKILHRPVLSVSYPYGAVDHRVIRIAADSGYSFGCGVYTGPAEFALEPFDIRRIAVDHRSGPGSFLMKLLTPYEYAEWYYRRIVRQTTIERAGDNNGAQDHTEPIHESAS